MIPRLAIVALAALGGCRAECARGDDELQTRVLRACSELVIDLNAAARRLIEPPRARVVMDPADRTWWFDADDFRDLGVATGELSAEIALCRTIRDLRGPAEIFEDLIYRFENQFSWADVHIAEFPHSDVIAERAHDYADPRRARAIALAEIAKAVRAINALPYRTD